MAGIEDQLIDSSRIIIDIVVANIGNDQKLFDEAVSVMIKDKHPVSMRAARVVYFVSHKHPEMIKPHFENLLPIISNTKIDGVKRCILAILFETPIYISEDQLGELTDICFGYVGDEKEPIAVRAQSIDILLKIASKYPEIIPELKAILENIMPETSSGLKNKCKKTIETLNKH